MPFAQHNLKYVDARHSQMKQIFASNEVAVPEGVTVSIKSRKVTVEGPRGKLERDFKFIKLDLKVVGNKQKKVRAELWFGNKEAAACIRYLLLLSSLSPPRAA